MSGLEATRTLHADPDPPHVIVLTTFDADEHVMSALAAGADGFLLKDTPPAQILEAIRSVAAGDPMLSPVGDPHPDRQGAHRPGRRPRAEVAKQRLDGAHRARARGGARRRPRPEQRRDRPELYLSVPTVKAHVSRLFDKLEVTNRVQIAICVHDAGLNGQSTQSRTPVSVAPPGSASTRSRTARRRLVCVRDAHGCASASSCLRTRGRGPHPSSIHPSCPSTNAVGLVRVRAEPHRLPCSGSSLDVVEPGATEDAANVVRFRRARTGPGAPAGGTRQVPSRGQRTDERLDPLVPLAGCHATIASRPPRRRARAMLAKAAAGSPKNIAPVRLMHHVVTRRARTGGPARRPVRTSRWRRPRPRPAAAPRRACGVERSTPSA